MDRENSRTCPHTCKSWRRAMHAFVTEKRTVWTVFWKDRLHNHSAGDFKPTTSGHCSSHTPTDDSYGYGYVHTLHASVVTPWLQPFSLLPWSELPDCPSSLLSLSPWPHADTHHEWVCTCPPRFQNPWPASNALLGCFDFRLKFNSDHIFEC